MCSPALAMGAQAGGGIFSAYNQVQAGKSERRYYGYMAETAEKQAAATLAAGERRVKGIQDQAASEFGKFKDDSKRLEGAQKVGLAANGVGAGSVTAENIANDTLSREQMDEYLIRRNADLEADETTRRSRYEAHDLKAQAIGYRMAGKNAVRSAKMNAFGTILGAAGQAGSTWYSAYGVPRGAAGRKADEERARKGKGK